MRFYGDVDTQGTGKVPREDVAKTGATPADIGAASSTDLQNHINDGQVHSGSASVATLSDAVITTPVDGEVLTYEASTQKWKNVAPTGGPGGGASEINGMNVMMEW